MRGDLKTRIVSTSSGANAVQVVRHEGRRVVIVKHIGSAHEPDELEQLKLAARDYIQAHCVQPRLAFDATPAPALRLTLLGVTHQFARDALLACAKRCGLSFLPQLYLDLALMRLIEPTSKLRALELLQRYFGIGYAERSMYRDLPQLLEHQAEIEKAAIHTAQTELGESFALVLYDVTTLYFESFKEYALQRPGFSKDNKPQQPQIVVGLITTRSGFPVMHEVFKGNTFEGSTMLGIVQRFQQRVGSCKPIIVGDAAMLSQANLIDLQAKGYRYIVGARLANLPVRMIHQIDQQTPRTDKAMHRFENALQPKHATLICEYSQTRYRKDKREFDKQVQRAVDLVAKQEPGRRAKFVRKAKTEKQFEFNDALRKKAEKLLGIKGYVTNIPELELSSAEVLSYYRELWHVEQAFRMSKSDLKTRPIFHHQTDAIRAHLLLCFMALMMGKFLEIKIGSSLRTIRDVLWQIHDATVRDESTGALHTLRSPFDHPVKTGLENLLNLSNRH